MVPVVVGELRVLPKCLKKTLVDLEIKRTIETIQNTAVLRSVRILGRVLET